MFDTFRDSLLLPPMIVLPAATFLMGSPRHEAGRCADFIEGPQRTMRIARPFALAALTVTRAMFEAFADANGHIHDSIVVPGADGTWGPDTSRSFRNPGFPQDDDHPAVGLNWYDAGAFVRWASEISGRNYRLPSEAEWEYAARAGTQTAFWWGDSIAPEQANCDHSHSYGGREPLGAPSGGTRPVSDYSCNPWGFFQTSGNVWEWCADSFSPHLSQLPEDGTPATTTQDNALHSLRGGSFLNGSWNLRSACRMGDPPSFRHVSFGLRIACSI